MQKEHLVFLTTGLYFNPCITQTKEKYKWLSKRYTGYILAILHDKNHDGYKIHDFTVHGLYMPEYWRRISLIRNLIFFFYILYKTIAINFFDKRINVILTRDSFNTGMAAWIASLLTGCAFVPDIVGNHARSFELRTMKSSFSDKLKHYAIMKISPFILNRAHAVKLLYLDQVSSFRNLKNDDKYLVFNEFVPVSLFEANALNQRNHKVILLLGGPWSIKGADILIEAFLQISDKFPDYRLKLVGWTTEHKLYEELARKSDKIELCPPVQYEDVVKLIGDCSLFVLSSRTEAMGCVLLEAMASKKPLIASDVDGIPTYVKDGFNGLLCKPENPDDLAKKITLLLSDKALAGEIATNGYKYAHSEVTENAYLEKFATLIDLALARRVNKLTH